jgi:1-deoxy-D-xylulose-5-phosphate reductoisomerase
MTMDVPKITRVAVLGSTGSIGTSTLDVAEHLPDRLRIVGLSAHSRIDLLIEQAHQFRPRYVCLTDPDAPLDPSRLPPGCELLRGQAGVARMVQADDVDTVVTAIVGAAGLEGTWAALEAGKTVAVANKETLVLAGALVTELAARKGVKLLPVDSEHSAIFQALAGSSIDEVERVVLTGSGGPFRGKTRAELAHATVEQALRHPTWSMGRKITIDSASMFNKGLEIIEAYHLFDLEADQIDVLVHPQSIIHGLVEFADRSVIAQMGAPDMRTPIAHCLAWPERMDGPAKKLDLAEIGQLTFEAPDPVRFPSLRLVQQALRAGGAIPTVFNAANEVAVDAFLNGRIGFGGIARLVEATMEAAARTNSLPKTADDALSIDHSSRNMARDLLPQIAAKAS